MLSSHLPKLFAWEQKIPIFPLPGVMTWRCSLVPRPVPLNRSQVPGLPRPLAFPKEKRLLGVPGCSLTPESSRI